jgi:hypothetical protein
MIPKHIIIIIALLVVSLDSSAQKRAITAASKIGDVISNIPIKGEKQAIITLPNTLLANSETQGWNYIEDLHARNASALFFSA